MKTDHPFKQAINNMVKVHLNKDGVVTMSYLVSDDDTADDEKRTFVIIVSIFQNH